MDTPPTATPQGESATPTPDDGAQSPPLRPSGPGQSVQTFPCINCGARLVYEPGTETMVCPYCDARQPVVAIDGEIVEHDYVQWQTSPIKPTGRVGAHQLSCPKCAAVLETDDLSTLCQFCGTPVVADIDPTEQIVPEGVVPFEIDAAEAKQAIRQWVGSRMFAPNGLKKVSTAERLKGTYLPHWTFDAATATQYSGMRGVNYVTHETVTVIVDGRPQQQTRAVVRTQWFPASGRTARTFDDVVVVATSRLSPEQISALAPWSLSGSKPYQSDYLSGYQTLRYDVEPDLGLEAAKQQMRTIILDDCRRDIGGDVQQVHSMDTRFGDLTFKLMLLPVWVAAYLYGGKTYQVFVNAHTGQVVGDRPYSIPKIAAAVIAGILVAAALFYLYATQNGNDTGTIGAYLNHLTTPPWPIIENRVGVPIRRE